MSCVAEADYFRVSSEDAAEMMEAIYEELDEFARANARLASSPRFASLASAHAVAFALDACALAFALDRDEECASAAGDVSRLAELCAAHYFELPFVAPRSVADARPRRAPDVATVCAQLAAVAATPQPAQRTPEWYAYRHDMLTASGIGKALGSPAAVASVVAEKCRPCRGLDGPAYEGGGNTYTPMHHGVKYEPLSAMLYERLTGARLGEFGCMRHPAHACIGASPDGIVVDPASDRYGRMLEIKNVFSRAITGVPLEAYWIQMQFQMEVFGLAECDFLETRFVEFADEAAYRADCASEHTGVVLYFLSSEATGYVRRYEYMPLEVRPAGAATWIAAKRAELAESGHSLFETLYWRLDQWSLVLVPRHDAWLAWAVPRALEVWAQVEAARAAGPGPAAAPYAPPKTRARVCVIKLE